MRLSPVVPLLLAASASSLDVGPSDFNCIYECIAQVSSANATCSSRVPGTGYQNWCVCETPALKTAMRPCLAANCTADALNYFFVDCELNFDGKPDPQSDTNGASAVAHIVGFSVLAATVLLAL